MPCPVSGDGRLLGAIGDGQHEQAADAVQYMPRVFVGRSSIGNVAHLAPQNRPPAIGARRSAAAAEWRPLLRPERIPAAGPRSSGIASIRQGSWELSESSRPMRRKTTNLIVLK